MNRRLDVPQPSGKQVPDMGLRTRGPEDFPGAAQLQQRLADSAAALRRALGGRR